jgi:hypothetical protein
MMDTSSLTKPRQALRRRDLVRSAGEAYALGIEARVTVSPILGCFCLIGSSTLLPHLHSLRKVPWTCARCKRIFLCIPFFMDCCGLFYRIFQSGTRFLRIVFFVFFFSWFSFSLINEQLTVEKSSHSPRDATVCRSLWATPHRGKIINLLIPTDRSLGPLYSWRCLKRKLNEVVNLSLRKGSFDWTILILPKPSPRILEHVIQPTNRQSHCRLKR